MSSEEEYYDDDYEVDGDQIADDEEEYDGEQGQPEEEEREEYEYELEVNGETRKMTATQMAEAIGTAETLRQEYDRAVDIINRYTSLLKGIDTDAFMQRVFQYRRMGYTDDQIEEGIANLVTEKRSKVEPTFATLEEERQWRIERMLEQKIATLENKIDAANERDRLAAIPQYNAQLVAKSVNDLSLSPTLLQSEKFRQILQEENDRWNQGVDLNIHQIDERMAKNIVDRAARRFSAMQKRPQSAKAGSRTEKLPRQIPGNVGTKTQQISRGAAQSREQMSRDEIISAWNEF